MNLTFMNVFSEKNIGYKLDPGCGYFSPKPVGLALCKPKFCQRRASNSMGKSIASKQT